MNLLVVRLIPSASRCNIVAWIISPLNGRNTMIRKVTAEQSARPSLGSELLTIDLYIWISSYNLTVRDFQKIPETNAKSDILYDLIRIFLMNIVLKCMSTRFVKIRRWDLNHVGYSCLRRWWVFIFMHTAEAHTRTNMTESAFPGSPTVKKRIRYT